MILITGTAQLKPGAAAAMREAADAMIAASLAEPACHAYRYAIDLSDPNLMTFHEEWEDEAAVQAHFATPHLAAFGAALPELLAGAPRITKWVNAEKSSLG